VTESEKRTALLRDRFTTANVLEEPPPKHQTPTPKLPLRNPRRVVRFLKEFDISRAGLKTKIN
jgi:hypothetical protein